MTRTRIPPEQRFWPKVDRRGPDECWPWLASLDPYGYGKFPTEMTDKAHRFAYALLIGPPPPIIDHTCHDPATCEGGVTCPHRRCCNPAHMTASTTVENALRGTGPAAINARKTHCPLDHPLSGDNLYEWTGRNGRVHRDCLTCRRDRAREYQRRRRV